MARESAINAAIKALRMTRILVAHRPQTIASADRVVVLAHAAIQQDLKVAQDQESAPLNVAA